ncbi:ETC complex I subunit [Sphingobium bisphenolivorans]|uniref:ETC complex I subunit n=1 Tax=Sphingobium bisphenolivorans TaxID=1335760 RepID=UPI0003A164DC|nr:ETC complex I subunit [Sphingobium bisphenolivorans]
MSALIYQIQKNALQSGKARTNQWVLDFAQSEPRKADPLTGWTGSGDTQSQVKLTFPSEEAARAYADRNGIAYKVIPTPPKTLKIQAYADNFR